MQVMHDRQIVWPDFVHRQQIADCLFESGIGVGITQIADMLADQHFAIDNQRDRVF